jgi:putative periplasmic peptidase (bacteriocin resistance)
LAQLKIPVIVYLKYRKNDHFSVLRGINGNTVLLADPSLGNMSLSREQFLAAWKTRDGTMESKILAVLPKNTDFFIRQPERQTRLVTEQLRVWQKW